MQGDAEEPPLISSPSRCEHSLGEIEERTVDPGAISQIHPHVTQLLCNKEAMASIVCVDHGHGVAETIGNFLQADFQTAFRILSY